MVGLVGLEEVGSPGYQSPEAIRILGEKTGGSKEVSGGTEMM